MLAFQSIRQDVPFVVDNPLTVQELMDNYGLPHNTSKLASTDAPFLRDTIVGQRHDLNMLLNMQASSLLIQILGMDDPRIRGDHGVHYRDTPKGTEDFFGIFPPADLRERLAFEALPVATTITGGKIIYVGEPIEISTGVNSTISYNSSFPRWAYDQFREIVAEMGEQNNWVYLDLWNLVPQELFGSSIFHLLPDGEGILAARISQILPGAICP
jgi:hypothetical protein